MTSNSDAIKTQFNLVAKEYDENRRKFIPCFDDYYIDSTNIIADAIKSTPNLVWDLGAGTGILTQFWYQHFPQSRYVLVDVAEQMLDIAKKRFALCENVEYKIANYAQSLPEGTPDAIISALSIHHLEHQQKKILFKNIFDALPAGGLFINYDQFCLENAKLNDSTEKLWIKKIYASGLSDSEIARWLERKKLDRECTIANETSWLNSAGFSSVEILFANGKFAVIVAQK